VQFFLLRSDRLARGELSDLFANRGDDLLYFLDSFLDGFFFFLDVLDLSFDDLNLSFILGILNLFLISLDVLFNDFKFLFGSLKSNFISFLDLSLLVNLSVNGALEGLDLFSLDEELLSLLEAFYLLFDDLNFFFFFLDFLFLGADNNLSDSYLLLDLFLFNSGLFQGLSGVSQFSSG